jgi:hypothetical protein
VAKEEFNSGRELLKAAEPYTCYREMDNIIFRYMGLCSDAKAGSKEE